MNFIKKFLPLLIVAVVFAIGGYFIGHGSVENQGAALYKGTSQLNPCDNSPVNPCPETKINHTCPEGFAFVSGRCTFIESYTKSAAEKLANKMAMTQAQWEDFCKKLFGGTGTLNSQNMCVRGAIAPGATSTSTTR